MPGVRAERPSQPEAAEGMQQDGGTPEATTPAPAGEQSQLPESAAEDSTPAASVLGVQTIKQFMSAASLLQSMQQRMLRADFTPSSIGNDATVSKVIFCPFFLLLLAFF